MLKEGERVANLTGMGEIYRKNKTLRKGDRRIGDWEGAELLGRRAAAKPGMPSVHECVFNSIGVADDPLRPMADVQLNTGVEGNTNGVNQPSLKDDEVVALWDKLTNSIRSRPIGAVAPAQSDGPDKPRAVGPRASAPLGTQLASGARCPQGGIWTCAEGKAVGGPRRVILEGETMPSVIVPLERSLLQRLMAEPEKQSVETVWTLTELCS